MSFADFVLAYLLGVLAGASIATWLHQRLAHRTYRSDAWTPTEIKITPRGWTVVRMDD